MKNNLLNFIILFFVSSSYNLNAQNKIIDSLISIIKYQKPDTNKVNHLELLATKLSDNAKNDTAEVVNISALKLAEKLNYNNGIMNLNNNLGTINIFKGNNLKALEFYNIALKTAEKLNEKKSMSKFIGNIGLVFWRQGEHHKALSLFLKSLKIKEQINDKNGIANMYGNIGNIYVSLSQHQKALEYYFLALNADTELKNKAGVSRHLGNIGNVYDEMSLIINDAKSKNELLEKALEYDQKALKLAQELGDLFSISRYYSNIGNVYLKTGNNDQALIYYEKALKLSQDLGNKNGISIRLSNIGGLYKVLKKYNLAVKYYNDAYILAKEIDSKELEGSHLKNLSELLELKGDYYLALEYYKKFTSLSDTIFSAEKGKEITKQEMNYEFEKKEAASKAEQDKKDAVTLAEKKKQNLVLLLVSCVLILVFVFAGFIFRTLRITRKQKILMELKNKETEEQKKLIEEKNKDIMDSIYYARRIQNSLLPTEMYLMRNIKSKK